MCGIAAYQGQKNANEVVLTGLKDMEYRGYDSWGIASLNGSITLVKDIGKIGSVQLDDLDLQETTCAVGHTRWSTHGGVTKTNAHPHLSSDGSFALAHNGIVENFLELRTQLETKGHIFLTETDTEIILRLVEEERKSEPDLQKAAMRAFTSIEGRNAVCLLERTGSDQNGGRIIGFRNGSPLLLGIGEGERMLSSDPSPVLRHTQDVLYLEDNEGVVISENGTKHAIFEISTGKGVEREVEHIQWTPEQARKGTSPHFMHKEIYEQRSTIRQALIQDPETIQSLSGAINEAVGIYAVGCGTAGKVCMAGTYAFSALAGKHINFCFGSEFPNYHHFITDKTLLIVVSQSGETADTLEAMDVFAKKGGKTISLVNVMGSTIMRQSTQGLMLNAGPEIAVASTKATTAQLALMLLLAFSADGRYDEGMKVLHNAADAIESMITPEYEKRVAAIAKDLKDKRNMYIIGRGINYPMAAEAAIKIQEVSYIHAEGFAGGELKHGPIALIEKGSPCIALVANDDTRTDMLSNIMEIKSRGAYIIGISPEPHESFDVHIPVPDVGIASCIANIIPIQILSYHLALEKGLDPDKPRNLAKSVTVK